MIVFCGCSYLSGYGIDYENSVATLLGKYLNTEVINLSKPGASNYCISKQIEYAISLNPDIIIFGTTEILRFDWVVPDEKLEEKPSLIDFSYNSYAPNFLKNKSKIMSESFRTLDNYLSGNNVNKYVIEKYRNIDKSDLKVMHTYFSYTNYNLKKDQDKKFIESSMFTLNNNKSKWVLIDGNNFFDITYNNILKIDWKKLVELDPQSDGLHFGTKANQVLADHIKELI